MTLKSITLGDKRVHSARLHLYQTLERTERLTDRGREQIVVARVGGESYRWELPGKEEYGGTFWGNGNVLCLKGDGSDMQCTDWTKL